MHTINAKAVRARSYMYENHTKVSLHENFQIYGKWLYKEVAALHNDHYAKVRSKVLYKVQHHYVHTQ